MSKIFPFAQDHQYKSLKDIVEKFLEYFGNTNFEDMSLSQKKFFTKAVEESIQELTTNLAYTQHSHQQSLQKISLRRLENIVKEINQGLELLVNKGPQQNLQSLDSKPYELKNNELSSTTPPPQTSLIPTSSQPITTPQPQATNNLSDKIGNSIAIETITIFCSEIFQLILKNSKKFNEIPAHHQETIFSTMDIATRFAVIAILANEDKISTFKGLSVASASSFLVKKSFNKLENLELLKNFTQRISSTPDLIKAMTKTGALVALYQLLTQVVFKEQNPDKTQTQQFSEAIALISISAIVAGATRVIFRSFKNEVQNFISSQQSRQRTARLDMINPQSETIPNPNPSTNNSNPRLTEIECTFCTVKPNPSNSILLD